MKLTYRGRFYEIPDLFQFGSDAADSRDQSKVKLIYRGQTYYTTPRAVEASEAVKSDQPTVTLIYRGITYEQTLPSPRYYQKPRAVNWRYQPEKSIEQE